MHFLPLVTLFLSQPPIQLPTIPDTPPIPAPTPAPIPAPSNVVKTLPADCFYIITAEKPFLVIGSPDGLVNVAKMQGPTGPMLGRFAEQPEVIQVKTFPQKFVAVITAKAAGNCELLIVPEGVADESGVVRTNLAVMGARPPPAPAPPDVTPTPSPTKEFRVLFFCERQGNLNQNQLTIWNSTKIRKYLDGKVVKGDKGPDYRFFDQHQDVSKDSQTIQDMVAASKPFKNLPCVVIFDGQKGTSYPFPATEADMLNLLQKAGGQ